MQLESERNSQAAFRGWEETPSSRILVSFPDCIPMEGVLLTLTSKAAQGPPGFPDSGLKTFQTFLTTTSSKGWLPRRAGAQRAGSAAAAAASVLRGALRWAERGPSPRALRGEWGRRGPRKEEALGAADLPAARREGRCLGVWRVFFGKRQMESDEVSYSKASAPQIRESQRCF